MQISTDAKQSVPIINSTMNQSLLDKTASPDTAGSRAVGRPNLLFIKRTLDRAIVQIRDNQSGTQDIESASQLSVFHLMHQLVLMIQPMSAACLSVSRVVSNQYSHSFEKFIQFLQAFETFGAGYHEDIDIRLYKMRDKQSHRNFTAKLLKDIIKMYDLVLIQLENEISGIFGGHQVKSGGQMSYGKSESFTNKSEHMGNKVIKDQFRNLFGFQR